MGQAPAVWIDVEDLFLYVRHNARLSGIQRLTYELYSALEQRVARDAPGGCRVGYVRIDPRDDTFRVVSWDQVRALCHGLTVAHAETTATPEALCRTKTARGMPRRMAVSLQNGLPRAAQASFKRFCTLQVAAARALGELGRETIRARSRTRQQVNRVLAPSQPAGMAHEALPATLDGVALFEMARPGDWLLSLGASWHRTDYGQLLQRARMQGGLRTGLLFYDLIPVRRPEWCHHTLVETFGRWLDGVLPQTDALFAISDATARDVERLLQERDRGDVRTVQVIPVGTGFPASAAAVRMEAEPVPTYAVPPAGSYVLMVSTIEARKNHMLMFQVWRRLTQTLPLDQVPTLVFAGRIGWLVSDLMLQIANTNYCDGKLLIVEDPSDAVLMQLYENCMFTVMPSMFEGWGLPVTESLAVGKPCITSNVTSLPEAGRGLTRLLDPFDLNDAVRVIGETIADRDGLARWQQEVRDQFRPVHWSRSADALLHALLGDTVAALPVPVAMAVDHA